MAAAYGETGSGFPLLMPHEFLGNCRCWQPLMERLKSHYHCIALDLLGFGDSAKPAIRYDIATEVAFVHQFLQAKKLPACYIVGHSLGGWVAAAYALAYPEVVQALLLAAPAGIRDDSFCRRYEHLRPLLWQSSIVDWALTVAKPLAALIGQRAPVEQFAWFRQELQAEPAARSFVMDRLRPEDAIDTVETEIHQLHIPTLVVTGDQDETIPLWHCQTYANEIPNAQLAIIPNADHALLQRYAAELAALILSFLSSQNPCRGTSPRSPAAWGPNSPTPPESEFWGDQRQSTAKK